MNERAVRLTMGLGAVLSLAAALVLLDTHRRADALASVGGIDPRVAEGRRAWRRHDCGACHTLRGHGSYYGPDLTKVYWRRGAEGIRLAVRAPEQVTTWRSMPHLPVTDRELADLVAFLQWTSGIDPDDWPIPGSRQRVSFEAVLADPRSVDPRAVMPGPGLVPPERRTLARYLAASR